MKRFIALILLIFCFVNISIAQIENDVEMTDVFTENDQLKADLKKVKTKYLESLKKRKKDKKSLIALREKYGKLLTKQKKLLDDYQRLEQQKSERNWISGYLKLGGSHAHFMGVGGVNLGLDFILNDMSVFGEGGYRKRNDNEIFYQIGIKYEIK